MTFCAWILLVDISEAVKEVLFLVLVGYLSRLGQSLDQVVDGRLPFLLQPIQQVRVDHVLHDDVALLKKLFNLDRCQLARLPAVQL